MDAEMTRLALTGAILAGGRSRRMGRDKADLVIALPSGERLTMLQIVSRALAEVCAEVLIVGGPARPDVTGRMVADLLPGVGPLSGIYSALQAAANELVFVAACDMPFIDRAAVASLAKLAGGHDAVIPRLHGRFEPLHAVYRKTCAGAAADILKDGPSEIAALFPRIKLRVVEDGEFAQLNPSGRSPVNLNTPAEFEAAVLSIGGSFVPGVDSG